MTELKPFYILQAIPTMTAEGYKVIGYEDIATADTAEGIYNEKVKADLSGNYQKLRIVRMCGLYVAEV